MIPPLEKDAIRRTYGLLVRFIRLVRSPNKGAWQRLEIHFRERPDGTVELLYPRITPPSVDIAKAGMTFSAAEEIE